MMETVKDKWTCPKCQTDMLGERISRNWLVKLVLGFMPLQRFMCYKCKRSYYSLIKTKSWTPHL